MKIKHSKYKNTGILFELLVRQITSDTLSGKNSPATGIMKKYFIKSELSKEYKLYEILLQKVGLTEGKADIIVNTVLESSKKLNKSYLKREKYNLIKEVRSKYDINNFFMARIPNYKVNASIFKLFSTKDDLKPQAETESRFTIVENITRKRISEKKKENVMVEGYRKQEKDLRLLAYSILIEKFNKKYSTLSSNQRNLLKEYINNISNTNSLKEFIETETIKVKKQLQSHLPKVSDKVTKIKLKEAINQAETLMKGRIVEDKQVVTLMRYYELVKELKNV